MLIEKYTKSCIFIWTLQIFCLLSCPTIAQTNSHQAHTSKIERVSHKQNSLGKKKPVISYPFPGVTLLRIPLGATVNNGYPILDIGLKNYWVYQTPYSDQQKLLSHDAKYWVQYVQSRVLSSMHKGVKSTNYTAQK